MRRGWRPLTWGADQGLRLVGGGEANHNATGVFAGPGEPSDASYRFRAIKVSPGQKHHGVVTKTQIQ